MGKGEAQEILDPFVLRLKKAVTEAVQQYFTGTEYTATRYKHSPRTVASICHDHIVEGIRNEFEGVEGVRFYTRKSLFLMNIKDQLVLRFKKFNKNLLASGINTQQLELFNNQSLLQQEFDNMPPYGLLHVGYTVNNLSTNLNGVYITYRYGRKNIWTWDLSELEKSTKVVTVPSRQKDTPRRKRNITAKGKETIVGDLNANNQ